MSYSIIGRIVKRGRRQSRSRPSQNKRVNAIFEQADQAFVDFVADASWEPTGTTRDYRIVAVDTEDV